LTPRPEESRVFLDTAIITIASGKGGDGKVSTRREKYVPRGGPDGGNGGRGGSVWLLADAHLTTLLDFRYRRKYEAEEGRQGGANNCTGADGHDIEIKVPCGTVVIDEETGEQIGDLVEAGDRLLLAEGGRGGKGNWEFRNARNQTPMKATPGKPGVERIVRFELKLIADIALVGEPNAGKSTLLSVLTAARPKVADYPFTTLVPNLGIVDLGDYASCTLADIPGLIEGASEGTGPWPRVPAPRRAHAGAAAAGRPVDGRAGRGARDAARRTGELRRSPGAPSVRGGRDQERRHERRRCGSGPGEGPSLGDWLRAPSTRCRSRRWPAAA
jgi:hypothetical protein